MNAEWKFLILMLASCLLFVGILYFVMRNRRQSPKASTIVVVALIVVVGGMLFARYGAQADLPWWIYYVVPMLLTVFLPPKVFAMTRSETFRYIILAFLSAPAIHVLFSFFLGWKEYMPFLPVPSLWELTGSV